MAREKQDIPKSIPEFLRYLFSKIVTRRKWWLLPLWVILAALGLILLLSGGPNLLPAIYIAF